MRERGADQKANAIEKALIILDCLAEQQEELGTVQISRLTGMHKATVSRILGVLVEFGMVKKNHVSHKYALGTLALKLGSSSHTQFIRDFVALAKPEIDALRDDIRASVSLEIWGDYKSSVCYLALGDSAPKDIYPFDVLPLNAPAGARAILAFISKAESDRVLREPLTQLTEHTNTSKSEIMADLVKVNRRGYAVEHEEVSLGFSGVGVPVFDQFSRPLAAITAVIPSESWSEDLEARLALRLKSASKKISAATSLVAISHP